MKFTFNCILLLLITLSFAACSKRAKPPRPANYYEIAQIRFSDKDRMKVDLAESLSDVDGCEKTEETKIGFILDTPMELLFRMGGPEVQKKETEETLIKLAKWLAVRKKADRVRLLETPEYDRSHKAYYQYAAFYSCN